MPDGDAPGMAATSAADLAHLYRAAREPALVDVPVLPFLMVDGHGDPNVSGQFRDAVQALYAVSYGLRFALKRAGGPDVRVAPLEGLWWADDLTVFRAGDKAAWDWTAMIRQPPEVTPALLAETVRAACAKKELPAAAALRLEPFEEGRAAQVLHVGPYADEGPTIERLHAFVAAQGLALRGKHHEIYLGDPRRAAPERLKTIIRQPVGPA